VDKLLSQAVEHFESVFKHRPTCASCAPGRVNLIGEHTDYNDGFVFPMVQRLIPLSLTIFCKSDVIGDFSFGIWYTLVFVQL